MSVMEKQVAGEAVEFAEFVAGVLRRAHRAAQADDAHDEARAILGVAHLFADDLARTNPRFDRLRFVHEATS
jgi:hypothetical protein